MGATSLRYSEFIHYGGLTGQGSPSLPVWIVLGTVLAVSGVREGGTGVAFLGSEFRPSQSLLLPYQPILTPGASEFIHIPLLNSCCFVFTQPLARYTAHCHLSSRQAFYIYYIHRHQEVEG